MRLNRRWLDRNETSCGKTFERKKIKEDPIHCHVAAISCGLYEKEVIIDDYIEDSNAETDANLVMNENYIF